MTPIGYLMTMLSQGYDFTPQLEHIFMRLANQIPTAKHYILGASLNYFWFSYQWCSRGCL